MSELHITKEVSSKQHNSIPLDQVHQAALIDCIPNSLQAAKQAIATVDNSAAAKEMFPGNEAKQKAAHAIMMHAGHFSEYENIDSAKKLLSPKELQQVDEHAAHYKPSMSARNVKAEALRLEELGFPNLQLHKTGDR
jgi:predicted negative regulator of RcsB-dependent stress response